MDPVTIALIVISIIAFLAICFGIYLYFSHREPVYVQPMPRVVPQPPAVAQRQIEELKRENRKLEANNRVLHVANRWWERAYDQHTLRTTQLAIEAKKESTRFAQEAITATNECSETYRQYNAHLMETKKEQTALIDEKLRYIRLQRKHIIFLKKHDEDRELSKFSREAKDDAWIHRNDYNRRNSR